MARTLYPPAPSRANRNSAGHTPGSPPLFRLSPLRIVRAQLFVDYLRDRGGKVLLCPRHYRELERLGLPAHAVDDAVQDLHTFGVAVIRMAGPRPVVQLKRPWFSFIEALGGAA